MITGCPKCGHVFKSKKVKPCPKCKSKGPYLQVRKVEDMEEKTEEIFHPKIDFRGH